MIAPPRTSLRTYSGILPKRHGILVELNQALIMGRREYKFPSFQWIFTKSVPFHFRQPEVRSRTKVAGDVPGS